MNVFDLNPANASMRRASVRGGGSGLRGGQTDSIGPVGRRAWPFSVVASHGGGASQGADEKGAANQAFIGDPTHPSCSFVS